MEVSSNSRLVATLLSFLLGGLGIHCFYVGKTRTGIVCYLLVVVSKMPR